MKRKEIFWLFGTLVLVLVLVLALFGLEGFNPDTTFDINIHDTYFVIANFHLVFLLLVFIFFSVYLIRTIGLNFKNRTANLVLMIATILFILVLGKTIGMLDFFTHPTGGNVFTQDEDSVAEILGMLSKFLFCLQITLLVLLAYCGFKTGRNYATEK